MKKTVLLIIMIYCSIGASFSQDFGNILLGGTLRYSFEIRDSDRQVERTNTSFLIEPSVGTMVSDKIAIGMAIGFFQTKSKSEHEDPDDYQSLSLIPFVRIHDSITDKFRIYLEPGFGKTFVLGDESDNKPQHYRARVDFGLLYFISQNLSLEINIAGINYIHMSDKDYGLKNNQFKIDYDLVYPNIGLKYYF